MRHRQRRAPRRIQGVEVLAEVVPIRGWAGRVEQGLSVVAESFEDMERTDERWWEAEVHRTRGELLRLMGLDTEGEASFRTAIDVARRQRAAALEWRAAASLAASKR
jgi:hypothetical protein